jgi:hypothetical protein
MVKELSPNFLVLIKSQFPRRTVTEFFTDFDEKRGVQRNNHNKNSDNAIRVVLIAEYIDWWLASALSIIYSVIHFQSLL